MADIGRTPSFPRKIIGSHADAKRMLPEGICPKKKKKKKISKKIHYQNLRCLWKG